MTTELSWVDGDACTLPTVERPLREAEFDAVFARDLTGASLMAPTRALLRFTGGAAVEHALRDLTARESDCCSFFGFAVTADDDEVTVAIEVPSSYAAVLTALVDRARSLGGLAGAA